MSSETAAFLSTGRYDWYVTKGWNRLHHADPAQLTADQLAGIEAEWAVPGPVTLSCGRTAGGLWIPGMFTRMGGQRCTGCCKALGYPQGKGSPKNDDTCRAILGLPSTGG